MQREWFVANDGTRLNLAVFETNIPRCVVQIVHGMNEHMGRYQDFAEFLNSKGVIVVGDDHRAHGLTAGVRDKVGKADYDIFEKTLSDEREITAYLKQKYKLPIVVLGHSYGSFLVQKYIQTPSAQDVAGFILTGTGKLDFLSVLFGRIVSNLNNVEKDANFIANLTFRAYDKKLKGNLNDWLTRDSNIVQRYNEDKFIVPVFSYGFYRSFFKGLMNLYSKDFKNIDKDTNICIMCGTKDGVGAWGKYPKALFEAYKKIGLNNVELKMYEDMRHEILNEIGKMDVYKDILAYINRVIKE